MRSQGRAAILAVLLGAGFCASPANLAGTASSPPLDRVTEKLICDCGCNNLTVKNCTCGKADRIRADVSARLSDGQTPEQVVQAYVAEYGEQILASPIPRGFNLIGWILPFGALFLGASLLILVIRHWSRIPASEAPLLPPLGVRAGSAPDPAFLKRVEEEMDDAER